ncbi:MAG: hypothetical protein FJ304_15310 [Planctomycetes bacterium]|nr:hypothetical protein [Planctomycetota bacterium]
MTKLDVTAEHKGKPLSDNVLITGTTARTDVKNSIIFASGHVLVSNVENSVIVAPSVRATVVTNSVIVAGDYLRLVNARRADGGRTVLVAGQWLRATTLGDAVCHVIRPGPGPSPDEAKSRPRDVPYTAIKASIIGGGVILNDRAAAQGTIKDTTFVAPKVPLAK